MYIICGTKYSNEDLQALGTLKDEFAGVVKKKESTLSSVEDKVQTLFTSCVKGDIKSLSKIIDSKIPSAGLFLINGYNSPISIHVQKDELHDVEIETSKLNLLELACTSGQSKIVSYLLKDLHLCHLDAKSNLPVHDRMALYVPCLKHDTAVFELVLQYFPLSRPDVRDLLYLLKQVQWLEGIELLLASKQCQRMYRGLSHQEQN